MISSTVSERKTTVASIRLRNSGRKFCFSSAATFSFMSSYELSARAASVVAHAPGSPRLEFVWSCFAPRFEVMMMIAVAEVDPAALGVRQVPVLEDLEEDVEHLRVGLLDLVEQDHAVVLAADGLGQLAALVEADVARGRPDQAADVVALHELAHVDLDERVLAAEHELGERLGELGLPDAGRAEEDERADRPLRVLEPGTRAADGLGDDLDRLLLADDPAVEGVLHLEQALGLLLRRCG